jgi:hypothetical protein
LTLRSPRRIFARKKRRPGASFALRSFAILAFAFTAAFGASVMAERRAVSDVAALRHDDPVLRLAAAGTARRTQRPQP